MAKVKNNPIIEGISGSIGEMVFRQLPNGETWVSGKPDFSRRNSARDRKATKAALKERRHMRARRQRPTPFTPSWRRGQ